jgi:hypothetical protein
VIALLGLFEKYVREVPKNLYTIVLIVIFFWACFSAWEELLITNKKNDAELVSLKTELNDLKLPKMRAVIVNMNVHELSQFPGVTSMVLVISVTNAGAPSIADHWDLQVTLPDGQKQRGVQIPIPPLLTFGGASGEQTYSEKDALYNKAVKNPIQKGQKMTGVLWFLLEGTSSKDVAMNAVKLTFKDFLDKEYIAENTAIYHGVPPVYFPGLEQQIKKGLFVK